MNRLQETLAQAWLNTQSSLFPPWLSEELGPLTAKQQALVTALELVRIEEFIVSGRGFPRRPAQDRTAIARAFVWPRWSTTRPRRGRYWIGWRAIALQRIWGWERKSDVPDEWAFSRTFAEFSFIPSARARA
ncbi:MAG: hypothetical protein PHG00_17585 [Methylococcales bacterium]|nr:hypothetical protein [Methylococcales bacterium]